MSTAIEAAEHIFISISRFRDLVALGTITRAPSGGYKLAKVREQYCKNAQAVMQGREADGAGGLTEQRTRIAAANAIKIETANAVEARRLVPIKDVADGITAVFEVLKENMFAMPARASAQIGGSPQEVQTNHNIIRLETYQVMDGIKASLAAVTKAAQAGTTVSINPNNLGCACGELDSKDTINE